MWIGSAAWGAWAAGAHANGAVVAAGCDADAAHAIRYAANFGEFMQYDLCDPAAWAAMAAGEGQVWTASPPCQPFSRMGRGAGWADHRARGALLLPVAAAAALPVAVAVENVWALAELAGPAGFMLWRRLWAEAGYVLVSTQVQASDFVPMTRNRLVAYAIRADVWDPGMERLLREPMGSPRTLGARPCPLADGWVEPGLANEFTRGAGLDGHEVEFYRYPSGALRAVRDGADIAVVGHLYGRAHHGRADPASARVWGDIVQPPGGRAPRFLAPLEVARLFACPPLVPQAPGLCGPG